MIKATLFEHVKFIERVYGNDLAKQFLWRYKSALEELFDLLTTIAEDEYKNISLENLSPAQKRLLELMVELQGIETI